VDIGANRQRFRFNVICNANQTTSGRGLCHFLSGDSPQLQFLQRTSYLDHYVAIALRRNKNVAMVQ
jgi:hypothetical protein